MISLFRERIREKIADQPLQIALDGNAERRVKSRVAAFASLPDWRERRQKTHAIRAEVIEHLDEYLAQFIGNVQKNGITVHRAKDAAEAVKLVLEIAANVGAKHTLTGTSASPLLFAKAKSMVSEEIGLNYALEAAGHRVIETDLGEYIIQLRGERPAHIITPAVHLRRHQVGKLFHEKLGIPYTEDIPTLTSAARQVLREVFLTADVGLSGVNFGVAETGTLTIVTNEGNGRMCTTLPPVHIALMGMERLLPTFDNLALFLSLLPRSATGQKLSVYTQLIHQPLAGQQRHLVIVDNGRLKLRDSSLREALYCIRCGACLNACPVFREIGGHAYLGENGSIAPYPGPIGSVVSPGLLGENFAQLTQASSLCGACKEACPVDIDLPKLLLRVRAGELPEIRVRRTRLNEITPSESQSNLTESLQEVWYDARPVQEGQGIPRILKLGLGGYSWIARHPRLFSVSQKLAGWFSAPLPPFLPMPAMTGWGFSKDLPKPAARPFRERWGEVVSTQVNRETSTQESSKTETTIELPASLLVSFSTPIDRFTAELTALGGQVYHISAGELPEKLTAFLRERGLNKVQMWDSVPALSAADLAEAGIRVEPFAPDPSTALGVGFSAGITGALAGIAETGTLVIPGGAGRPLTASLVPEIHIAVLRTSDILPSLEQAIRLPDVASAPATVLITGPSRTADIEMTLTIGVHGPKELHVFVVDF